MEESSPSVSLLQSLAACVWGFCYRHIATNRRFQLDRCSAATPLPKCVYR
jgi:hypothetical protein